MAGCVSETGSSGSCIDGKGLDGPVGVVVSSDGRQVYVASQNSSAVAILDRDLATGALTPKNATAGCTSDTGTGGECVDGRALGQPRAVLISPDGESVYVVAQAQGSLATFDRDPLSGELVQKSLAAGCFGIAGNTDGCSVNNFLALATGGAASPDGRSVYVSAITSDVMLVFARDLPVLDVDGDGVVSPLTDGLLLLRYSFGFTGSTLITGAVDQAACTRCTAEQIEAFIQGAIDDV
jgi:DNA-binding beta-propeller fold protein YncE